MSQNFRAQRRLPGFFKSLPFNCVLTMVTMGKSVSAVASDQALSVVIFTARHHQAHCVKRTALNLDKKEFFCARRRLWRIAVERSCCTLNLFDMRWRDKDGIFRCIPDRLFISISKKNIGNGCGQSTLCLCPVLSIDDFCHRQPRPGWYMNSQLRHPVWWSATDTCDTTSANKTFPRN